MTANLCKLVSNHAGRAVGVVFLKVMTEQPFPVGFKGVVNGMPVPVFHHVGSGSKVAVGLQPELSVIGQPVGKTLGLRFQYKVIASL